MSKVIVTFFRPPSPTNGAMVDVAAADLLEAKGCDGTQIFQKKVVIRI